MSMRQIMPLSATDQRALHLPALTTDGIPIEYYTAIDPGWKVGVLGYDHWDVLGIARGSSYQIPMVMTLTAIDHEILESIEEQDALTTFRGNTRIAPNGCISLTVDAFNAFCLWFQSLRPPSGAVSQGENQYFYLQDVQDLAALGIRSSHLSPRLMSSAHWYRYQNTKLFDPNEDICLAELGGWSAPNRETSRRTLRIVSYTRQHLQNSDFDPLETEGLGYLRFDPAGFDAFVTLLQDHRFEAQHS